MSTRRLPPWIRNRLPTVTAVASLRAVTYDTGLPTVCQEARCPNQAECSRKRTATFLIPGDRCTRDCGFCAIEHGVPEPVAANEAERVADAISALGLTHAVITSVTRDDLADGGASVFARTVRAVRSIASGVTIELLVPDFQGSTEAIDVVVRARPEVIAHNLETVPRLYPALRRGACYQRSLHLIRRVSQIERDIVTKSGIMVGAGETWGEVDETIHDLVTAGCRVLTIGQYLRPSPRHHPVDRFVPPEEFEHAKKRALAAGIHTVVAGPLVRSSYHAAQALGPRSL